MSFARKGFTLIEVMVAAVILVAGIVFIYESFFLSLDVFGYCSDYYRVSSWMDEKVWQIEDDIRKYGFLARIDKAGRYNDDVRSYYWNASCNLIEESAELDLYNIELELSWQIGAKKFRLARAAYATYEYKEEEK